MRSLLTPTGESASPEARLKTYHELEDSILRPPGYQAKPIKLVAAAGGLGSEAREDQEVPEARAATEKPFQAAEEVEPGQKEEERALQEAHRERARSCLEQQTQAQYSEMTEELRAEINRGNWHKLRDTAEPSTLLALVLHFMHVIDRNSLFPASAHAKALCDALRHVLDAN